MSRGHQVRPLTSVTTGAICGLAVAVSALGIAWSVTRTDNMVPAQSISEICGPYPVCQTDNAVVYFYMDSAGRDALEAADDRMVNEVIDDEYRPTDLVFHYDSTPVFSGRGETDWYYQEESVSGSAEGRTVCNDPVNTYQCDQHYITIEPGHWTHGLTCHESGHAAGLVHGPSAAPPVGAQNPVLGCLRKVTTSGMILGANQKRLIDATY